MAIFSPRERAYFKTERLPTDISKGPGGSVSGVQAVSGMAGLMAALDELRVGVARSAMRKAGKAAGEVVRKEAQSRAPVGQTPHKTYKGRIVAPGFLQRHVQVKSSFRSRTGLLRVTIGPHKEAFYGSQFVEIGTSKMPKQPWLVPALVSTRGEVEEIFVGALRAAIQKAVAQGKKK